MRYISTKAYQGFKFSCGWSLSKQHTRVQKDWYLGNDQRKAECLETFIKNEWKKCKAKGNPIWTPESLEAIQVEKTSLYGSSAVKLPQPSQPSATDTEHNKLTFYQALDAFITDAIPTFSCNKLHKEHLRQRVGWLKRCCEDFPIDGLDHSQLSKMTAYWKSRPLNQHSKDPLSIATVDIAISTLKRVCGWLYDSEKWDGFRGWQKLLSLSAYKPELTDDEILEQSKAVVGKVNSQRFTVEELRILYQSASSLTRKYMLFALNCGMTQLEISGLMRGEVYLDHDPPIIAKARRKTTTIIKPIASKWLLWDETIEVCRNLLEGKIEDIEHNGVAVIHTKAGKDHAVYIPKNLKPRIKDAIKQNTIGQYCQLPENNWLFGRELVYVTEDNFRVDLVRNNWYRLLEKLDGKVRPLGFKFLRKTGADIIREIADESVAKLYLSHTPTSTATRHYIGLPYDQLFEALKKMRQRLNLMFLPLTVQTAPRTPLEQMFSQDEGKGKSETPPN